MPLTHLNPESLSQSPPFSQGVLIEGSGSLLLVGGQKGIDSQGNLVGDDLRSQSAQALRNVIAVLESAGRTQADVARLAISLVEGGDVNEAGRG